MLFRSVRSEVKSVRLELGALEKRVDAKFLSVEAKLEQVVSAVHHVAALVEEQNSRNLYVLDGYAGLDAAQQDLSDRVAKLEAKLA